VMELANPLSQRSSCSTLRIPRSAFSCMQTLLSSILTSYGGKAVHGVTVMFDHYLIWSTLTTKDTCALYQFALAAFHHLPVRPLPSRCEFELQAELCYPTLRF
jgi:hypothetical protein